MDARNASPSSRDVVTRRRFFYEVRDPVARVRLEDAQPARLVPPHGDGRDGDVGTRRLVRVKHRHEVHAVELVARKDQVVGGGLIGEVDEVLAHSVRGALVPILRLEGLLGGEHFHEPVAEGVEPVGVVDVPVQGGGIELGEDVDLAQPGVDAVRDGDVHEPELAAEGHRGLGALGRERVQSLPPAAPQDDRYDFRHHAPLDLV
jgi:hypothetical protein